MADVTQLIKDSAPEPKRFQAGEVQSEQRSLDELIRADRYLRQQDSAEANALGGIRLAKIVPPGAV